VLSVGGAKINSYDALAPLIASTPRPFRVEFLRRRRPDPEGWSAHVALIAQPAPTAVSGHKQILKSVSGCTLAGVVRATGPPGRERLPAMVCGIMGPSGAGKTSLLDVLAGRKTVGTVTGAVRINGRAMTPREMRLLSGYVVQEDILPPMLTVRECLDFQARLRVPAGGGGPSARVEAVLKRLKLVRQAGTLIGNEFRRGLSGGEKRRVSVAIELLSEPAILFLDEPTTGQDSTTAVMLCKALRKIARVCFLSLSLFLFLLLFSSWISPCFYRTVPRS
jgi:ABC-type lipoprotein export system ATPase subunit